MEVVVAVDGAVIAFELEVKFPVRLVAATVEGIVMEEEMS